MERQIESLEQLDDALRDSVIWQWGTVLRAAQAAGFDEPEPHSLNLEQTPSGEYVATFVVSDTMTMALEPLTMQLVVAEQGHDRRVHVRFFNGSGVETAQFHAPADDPAATAELN